MPSVIVIGGGLAGVSSAYQLALRGFDVQLFEAKDQLADATSAANGGMLTPSQPEPWNQPGVGWHLLESLTDPKSGMKLRVKALPGLLGWGLKFLANARRSHHRRAAAANYDLARYSVAETVLLADRLDLDFDLASTGTFKVFKDDKSLEAAIQNLKRFEETGPRYEVLSRDAAIKAEPQLQHADFVGGILHPDDWIGDARAFTHALAAVAEKQGVHFHIASPVEKLAVTDDRIAGVWVTGREIQADHVLVTAAHASRSLLLPLGIDLPLRPAKGYSATLNVDGWNDAPKLCVLDEAKHIAVVRIGRRVRLVGSAEFAGEDLSQPDERVDNLFDSLRTLYPHLADRITKEACDVWAGLRPMSADGMPFIGATGPKGLWLNTGHGHLGWTMATGSACLLADLMMGADPAIDPTPFKASRIGK